jgi:hypothetical protein
MEFLGVPNDPDVPDPVACIVEREHRDGGSVALSALSHFRWWLNVPM